MKNSTITINEKTFANCKSVAELQNTLKKLQEDINKYGELRYKELAPQASSKGKKTEPKVEAKTEQKSTKRETVKQVKMASLSADDVKKLGLKFVKVDEWQSAVLLQGNTRSLRDEFVSRKLQWNSKHKGWKIPAIKNDKYGDTYGDIAKALHLRKIKIA